MERKDIKERLIRRAGELNISAVGFAAARVYTELEDILAKRGEVPFVNFSARERIDPFMSMPEAKSLVVYLCSYHTGRRANISEYAMGEDYHIVLGRMGRSLGRVLEEEGFRFLAYSDSGPLNERYAAYLAGLGFFGKNGFLINPDWGTYTFIGYLITDCALPPDKPMKAKCAGCGACIKACPGGALGEGFFYDADKCASYISQKKGTLSPEEERILKSCGSAWGCDICQRVCPHNEKARLTEIAEFSENLIGRLEPEKDMSARGFRKKYAERAFSWRGKKVIERNLEIIEKSDG